MEDKTWHLQHSNWEGARQRLRDIRAAKRWTQKHLAAQMGVTQSRVSDWEYGHSQPTIKNLAMWGNALGLKIEALITGGTASYMITDPKDGIIWP